MQLFWNLLDAQRYLYISTSSYNVILTLILWTQGCGIVTFSTEEEAQHAIETLNDTELDGRKIFVREDREVASGGPAATSDRNSSGTRGHTATRVYIGNLSWNVKWQDLKDHMKQAGNVVHADGKSVSLAQPSLCS
jgi:RNA recognition motif-containing protein